MQSSLLFVVFAVTAPEFKEAPKKAEAPGIAGEWTVESWITGGKNTGIAGMTYVFKENGDFTVRLTGAEPRQFTFRIDAAKSPMHFDWGTKDGKQSYLGIFKVAGDDLTLTFADQTGLERPKDFVSATGSQYSVLTLKRVRPAKK